MKIGIKGRLITVVLCLSFAAVASIGTASYKFSTSNAVDVAKEKGDIIFNYIMAQRDFFRLEQRSLAMEIVEHDRFYPTLMSGFVVTRSTWDRFKENLPGYMFKQATIDPLFPANKADEDELNIISEFKASESTKRLEGIINKKGEDFYYIATPIKITKKGCLRCHGNPAKAPKDQIEIYGTEHGYNWKMGDTVATFIVYVSLDKAVAKARKTSMILVSIAAGIILVLVIFIWVFINFVVVNPILKLSTRAEQVSLGRNLKETISHRTDDEIGHLASAINRLRISLLKILQRVEKK